MRKVDRSYHMLTTFIFDIGNVLADFGWKEYFESFHFPKEIIPRIAKATVLSPTWNDFDRGAKTDEELINSFIKNDPELEPQIRKLCENVHDMITKRDYAIPWILELKQKGYRVLYLSNFSHKAEIECQDALDFIPYTDGGILSYQEKLVKPEPEIYQRLIERYDLIPEECVFLDDRMDNCEAAAKFGMKTICFTTKEAAIEELKKYHVY